MNTESNGTVDGYTEITNTFGQQLSRPLLTEARVVKRKATKFDVGAYGSRLRFCRAKLKEA
jgi:hypothetical protein